jgi:hypothetical protein
MELKVRQILTLLLWRGYTALTNLTYKATDQCQFQWMIK